jgi:putative ABC transport system permease protein
MASEWGGTGLATTIARRSLFKRPGRTLFSILGVALGIATVVAVFTLDHNTILLQKKRAGGADEWRADVEVRPKAGIEDAGVQLASVEGVAEAVANFENEVQVIVPAPGQPAPLRSNAKLFAVDAEAVRALGAYNLTAGRDIEPAAQATEVLVGPALAEQYGLVPGSEIRLARPPRAAQRRCVEGEMREVGSAGRQLPGEAFRVVGVLAPERLGRHALGHVVVVGYRRGLELFEDVMIQSRFWVKRDPGVDIERLERGLGLDFASKVDPGGIIGETVEERAFRNGVMLAGLLAMALGLYVIFHTLSVSLVERIREVGVLHALGASRRQVARVFFAEAVFISLAAGGAGLAMGLGLAKVMLAEGMTTLGWDKHKKVADISVPWDVVLPLVAIGLGIALMGSVYPLLKARRTDTVSALRGGDQAHQKGVARGFHVFAAVLLLGVLPALYFLVAPIVGEKDSQLVAMVMGGVAIMSLFLLVPLVVPSLVTLACAKLLAPAARKWPLAGTLAARSVEQGPTRIGASIAAIALVTAAFVGLKGMTGSLKAEVQDWASEAVVGRVWVRKLPDVPFAGLSQILHQDPGVLGVETSDARARLGFLVIGVKEAELARWGPLAEDPRLMTVMRGAQGMIVSRRLARARGLVVGSEVPVSTAGHGVQTFHVIAITDEYGYFPLPDERFSGTCYGPTSTSRRCASTPAPRWSSTTSRTSRATSSCST